MILGIDGREEMLSKECCVYNSRLYVQRDISFDAYENLTTKVFYMALIYTCLSKKIFVDVLFLGLQ